MEIYGYFRQICLLLLAPFPLKLICYAWLTVEWMYSLIDWSLYKVSLILITAVLNFKPFQHKKDYHRYYPSVSGPDMVDI